MTAGRKLIEIKIYSLHFAVDYNVRVRLRVIGHLYSVLLCDEPIAKALRYGP